MPATLLICTAVMPLSAAFFNLLVPIQVGARDVAFPRLNAFSLWVWVGGATLLNVGWLSHFVPSWDFGGAPDIGWFGYSPPPPKQVNPHPFHHLLGFGIPTL